MSYFVTTEILCNYPLCSASIEGAGGRSVKRRTADKKASSKGWDCVDNEKHYCPGCRGRADED